VLEGQKPDVAILQGIRCDAAGFERLAGLLGMHCRVSHGRESRIALDPGRRGCGMGIMWKPEIVPVPDSLTTFEHVPLHSGMVVAELVISGIRIAFASAHLPSSLLVLQS
jgi:hypothetical protein